MNILGNIQFRIIISLILILVIYKLLEITIQFIFRRFFSDEMQKNSEYDLDAMIRRKKMDLRNGGLDPTSAIIQGSTDSPSEEPVRKNESKTSIYYQRAYKKASLENDKEKLESTKQVLVLLDNIHWGSGKELEQISNECSSLLKQTIHPEQVNRSLHHFIQNDSILNIKQIELPNLKAIKEMVKTQITIDTILKEAKQRTGGLIIDMANRLNYPQIIIAQAIESIILRQMGLKNGSIYSSILSTDYQQKSYLLTLNENKVTTAASKLLLTPDEKKITDSLKILETIKEEAIYISCFTKIPALASNNDIDGAYAILALPNDATFSDVKQRYRSLAAEKHPDKLSGRDLPDYLVKIANNNFTNIQQAFDIIKKARN